MPYLISSQSLRTALDPTLPNPAGMKRTSRLLGLALILASSAVAGPRAGPLKVRTTPAPGPHFVGQAIEVEVHVEAGPGPPTVEAPRLAGAVVRPLPGERSRPSVARFLVVPARPGFLDLPPFRARSGDRSGASRPSRLRVVNVPPEGRTSAFLGGVGMFEVRAEADPSSVRAGQTLEYRVRISGPAAWGSVRPPDLGELASPTLRIEPLPDTFDAAGTPVRTFRYKLRPAGAGRVVLPPVSVSAFDPKTGRYATRATSGVPIRVEEPPQFDPARLDYKPVGLAKPDQRLGLSAVGLGVSIAALATAGLWFLSKRTPDAKRVVPWALALELARGLAGGDDDDEVEAARSITEALTTFLQRVEGRAPGVLTPPELRDAVGRLTGDHVLAGFAESLLVHCDRARYGPAGGDVSRLIGEGRGVFEAIAGVMAGEVRGEEGPREAVETA